MRKSLLAASLAFAIGSTGHAFAAPFPEVGASTSGPAVTFTFTPTGIVTAFLTSQTYDGNDDVEVGIINNSGMTQTSLSLTGSGNGGGIFGFDGDGIIHFTDALTGNLTLGNPADTSGYAGPGVTFSNINATQTSGTVNFSIPNGGTAYFGLESSPNSIQSGGGIVVTPMPEPSSVLMLLAALAGLFMIGRSKAGHSA